MARSGSAGAQCALDLAAEPGRFLSTVQSGITLIAVFAGAFSGEALGGPAAERLQLAGVSADTAHTLGFGLVIVLTTFVSLVIGEIVPKQIALRSPEPIAVVMARPMRWLSVITAPFVWLLDRSSVLIFKTVRFRPRVRNQVTAEELHLVVAEAQTAGRPRGERARDHLRDRAPRRPSGAGGHDSADRDRLDRSSTAAPRRCAKRCSGHAHTRIPVADGSVENIVGVVQIRDVVAALLENRPLDLRDSMPQGAGDPRPHGRDGRAGRASQRRGAAGAGARRIWPSRRDRHSGQHPRRACRDLRSRRRAGRRAAAGRARGRQLARLRRRERRPAIRPARRDHARRSRLFDRGRLRVVGPQALARDGRDLPPRRLVVRDRRHGRPQDRQADRVAARGSAPPRTRLQRR